MEYDFFIYSSFGIWAISLLGNFVISWLQLQRQINILNYSGKSPNAHEVLISNNEA